MSKLSSDGELALLEIERVVGFPVAIEADAEDFPLELLVELVEVEPEDALRVELELDVAGAVEVVADDVFFVALELDVAGLVVVV